VREKIANKSLMLLVNIKVRFFPADMFIAIKNIYSARYQILIDAIFSTLYITSCKRDLKSPSFLICNEKKTLGIALVHDSLATLMCDTVENLPD
jgi:hypothetical protein